MAPYRMKKKGDAGLGAVEDPPLRAQREPWQKYKNYALTVDPQQNDRATQLRCACCCCGNSRPHFRALVCSWWGLFMSFFVWFGIASLLGDMRYTFQLTKHEIWMTSIIGVCGTMTSRILLGPLCDRLGGPRLWMMLILVATSFVAAMTGLVDQYKGLAALRYFLGFAGGVFVIAQHWTSLMFAKNIIGTVLGLVAGWGSIGGCLSQRLIGKGLLPAFEEMYTKQDEADPQEKAWRTVLTIPAAFVFLSGIIIYFISDDTPKGNYRELRRHNGSLQQISFLRYVIQALISSHATVILFIQFACCHGVELTMRNAAALYLRTEFYVYTEEAVALVEQSCYMYLVGPLVGGILSDVANSKFGMRGRIIVQAILLLAEAILVFVFTTTNSIASAKAVYFLVILFAQAAQGSTFGIAPYVCVPATGFVMGWVAAGGNLGAVCFGMAFRELPDYMDAFHIMGGLTIFAALLSSLIFIRGQTSLFCGKNLCGPAVEEYSTQNSTSANHTSANMTNDEDEEEEEIRA